MNFEENSPDKDSIEYTPNGKSLKIGIYPRLGSGYPDYIIDAQLKSGKAPEKSPFRVVAKAMREVDGKIYVFYGVEFQSLDLEGMITDGTPTADQFVSVILQPNGEKVFQAVGNLHEWPSCINYTFNLFLLKEKSKALENLTTKIHPINEATFTQDFSAQVVFPDFGTYEYRGSTKEIRDGGGTPSAGFKYWKKAYGLPGEVSALIAQDFTEAWHIAIFKNKTLEIVSKEPSFQAALSAAKNNIDFYGK